jgi:nitroreductase
MTRDFDGERAVPDDVIRDLVDLARRAPSAGKTQGWHLVVLSGTETSRFWDVTLPADRRAGFAFPGLLRAPVILLPLADPQAYLERYSEADKAATGWGEDLDRWSAPYWTIDASMAVMTLLLAAEDAGLGALLFAVSRDPDLLRRSLGVPEHLQLLGAIALGWPSGSPGRAGRSAQRPRRSAEEILHWGSW